ncbi:MAG TPA: Do family serine endopeptidase [Gemmatimonadaceae bacterium]
MKSNPIARLTFGGALVAAFVGGLVFASGLDLTKFGYAQSSARTTSSVAPIVPPGVSDLNVAFSSIAERVTPAVVSIHSERTQRQTSQRQQPQQPQQPQRQRPRSFEDFFGQFDREPPVPMEASGSGFIVSADGYILTNNHVIQGFDRVEVTLTDRRTFPARVIGRDETTDVAVLKIDQKGLPYTSLGDDNGTKIGEWVVAIGNPLGLDFTVTAGIVSAKGRGGNDVRVNQNNWAITDFIQTDAAINPGNSGGPLVNVRGEVIGINTAIASQTGYYSGYGFAIPITLAKEVLDDFIEHGRVRRAVLGVSIRDAQAEDAAVAGLKDVTGVLVQPFTADNNNSPARRAGIEPGDVIVKADGKPADRVSTLQRIIRSHEPGQTVEIEAWRFGTRKTFNVRLGEATDSTTRVASNTRPGNDEPETAGTNTEKLGITVEPITEAQARQNEISIDHRGLRVVDIDPNGPARQRLQRNDILLSVINPQPRRTLQTANDLQQALAGVRDGGYLSLMVYNLDQEQTRIVNLRIGK